MTDSIVSNERKCFICGAVNGLHRHHVYGGSRRQLSERFGCWCYLCGWHHNLSNSGVHADRQFDLKLKRLTQERWEETNGNRDAFIAVFGRSYL